MKGDMMPMLAAEGVLGKIEYPKYGSFKYNGVRGLVIEGKAMARSLKPVRNRYTRFMFSRPEFNGFDGELVVGPASAEDAFTQTTSGVGTVDGSPDVNLYVFDLHDIQDRSFTHRIEQRKKRLLDAVKTVGTVACSRVMIVEHRLLHNDTDLLTMEREALGLGYEGLVLRDPAAPYKWGRSTAKEGGFMRFCRWVTGEVEILGVYESETNTNEKKRNELGYAKRSSHKAGMQKTGSAGGITCRELKTGVKFNIPISLPKDKAWFWENRNKVGGKIGKYRSRPTVKDAPRYAQWEGFREKWDMS